MHEDQTKKKHIHIHTPLLSDDNSHNGLPLYSNYANDTTLTSNSTPASATIAVVEMGTQWFRLC